MGNVVTFKLKKAKEKTERWFKSMLKRKYLEQLEELAKVGVRALAAETPKDTGLTAASWSYEIGYDYDNDTYTIAFSNSNVKDGWLNVAVILSKGHATRNGAWVEGNDYIDRALTPIFNQIAASAWKVVTSS